MKAVVFVIGDKHIHINAWDAENPNISKALLMNNDQIATLSDHGFEIGVHTLTHPSLTDLSEEEYLNEIKTPKIVMEGIIGNKIHSFSYPYGKVNSSVKKFVKQSGYRYACSVYSGPVKFGEDPFEIRRIAIHNRVTIAGFALRLVSPYEYLEWLWFRARNGSSQN